jgi:hypothetical protein
VQRRGIRKPLVKVSALEASPEQRRLGFLVGKIALPENRMGKAKITALSDLSDGLR